MEALIYILPIWLFFRLTTRQQRADMLIYFWLVVGAAGIGGFLFELFSTGRFPPPIGAG